VEGGADPAQLAADPERLAAVREMVQHAWAGYRAFAWGRDVLRPVSRGGDDALGGLCATLVDSLDTLLLAGLRAEFEAGVALLDSCLVLDKQEDINVFEATIRLIGGLLAAFELDGRREPRLLRKAAHVADALAFAFESPTGLPYGTVGLRTRRKYNPSWVAGSTIAEVATLSLEWEHLSHLSGEPRYALLVRRAMAALLVAEVSSDSLFPTYINPDSAEWASSHVTLGARGDSTIEYLLKSYLLAGGTGDTREWAAAEADGADGGDGRAPARTRMRHRGLVGNAALLAASADRGGALTTADYAPPAASKAGAVWRACASEVEGAGGEDEHPAAASLPAAEASTGAVGWNSSARTP
jgi:hypothetical protein